MGPYAHRSIQFVWSHAAGPHPSSPYTAFLFTSQCHRRQAHSLTASSGLQAHRHPDVSGRQPRAHPLGPKPKQTQGDLQLQVC